AAGYHPRESYLLSYLPAIRYNFTDQLTPVVKLVRRYGPTTGPAYALTHLDLGLGLGSTVLDWRFQHQAPLHLHDTRSTYRIEAFSRDGVDGAMVELARTWSRILRVRPVYTARVSLASVDVRDNSYAPHLFDLGRVTTATTVLAVERRTMKWRYDYALAAAAGAPTLGDFDFSRFTFELRANRSIEPWELKLRFLAGGIWSGGPIPNQERFTVATAGSMDSYNRSYLSAEGSLFGIPTDVQGHYHLPGDANLRGYYDMDYFGVERLFSTTLELSRSVKIKRIGTLGGRVFLDAGQLWGDRFALDDSQFDGDLLYDMGFGADWSRRLFGQQLYFRVDFPFLRLAGGTDVDFGRWVFSFQRGL
ncbi:MAG: hypothetical protein V3U35_08495, partial [Candidatus Neomarinimicrobiota bacterium]